jgi:DNA polymerase
VPAGFLALCGAVILHATPRVSPCSIACCGACSANPCCGTTRWTPTCWQARQMARAVQREIHKMRAFVRFRQVQEETGPPLHVAWFEPEHHIVDANAPMVQPPLREPAMGHPRPRRCVEWDGRQLHFRGGASRAMHRPPTREKPVADYYQSIFNPARLKLAMT